MRTGPEPSSPPSPAPTSRPTGSRRRPSATKDVYKASAVRPRFGLRPAPDPGPGAGVELGGGYLGGVGDLAGVGEGLPGQRLPAEDPPPAFLQVQPAGALGDEGVADAGVVLQPGAGALAVVAGEVIAEQCSRSTVKNSLALLVRVMEQAVRDGIIDRNPARIVGWQREYQQAEDEFDDPRSLALPDWESLSQLAAALVERSADRFAGWGEVVIFAACTAARIGEVSGVRRVDIDRDAWTWKVRRQTTPGPGGLIDKGTKGKRARTVPLIEEVRPLVARRLDVAAPDPMARLFTGPRGGRITTAVLRDATHWDEVVVGLDYEHLRRHDLRHTGLTWMADAGVPLHVLRKIAGHGSLATTQQYLHPDAQSILDAGDALSAHLTARRASTSHLQAVGE
jgi:integrase